jgi:hypothetical protein
MKENDECKIIGTMPSEEKLIEILAKLLADQRGQELVSCKIIRKEETA